MATDIERQFFDTFGIEPKLPDYNEGYCDGCEIDDDACERCCPHKARITDRILLELIRIIGKKPFGYLQCENTYSTNLGDTRDMITVVSDDLKEGLLTLAIQKKVVLRIKQQVQALF